MIVDGKFQLLLLAATDREYFGCCCCCCCCAAAKISIRVVPLSVSFVFSFLVSCLFWSRFITTWLSFLVVGLVGWSCLVAKAVFFYSFILFLYIFFFFSLSLSSLLVTMLGFEDSVERKTGGGRKFRHPGAF